MVKTISILFSLICCFKYLTDGLTQNILESGIKKLDLSQEKKLMNIELELSITPLL